MKRQWTRRAAAIVAMVGTAFGLVSVSSGAGAQTDDTAAADPTVQVGVSDPKDATIAVLEFMPATAKVAVGSTLTWSWKGTFEPHSVTFLAPGQQLPAPGSDPSLFAPTRPTGPYDGTAFVNSGLQPLGAAAVPFSLTFSKAGSYTYYCVIHPNMVGTVDVVDGAGDSAAKLTAVGKAEQAKWLAEGRVAKKKLVRSSTKAKPAKNADGSSTWQVQMGASTEHTDVLAFAPTPRLVKAGDSVTFVNNSSAPHTATFNGGQTPITSPLDPRTAQAIPGPSPQTLNANGQFNTGELAPNVAAPGTQPPPLAARSFTFVVPSGKYEYYCILHVPSGMAGTITAS